MKKDPVIRAYYGFSTTFQLLVWVPVFYQIQKQLGLNDATIFEIQSIYYVVFALLEIPTGWVADRFGYKASLIAAGGSLLIANLVPIFDSSASGFLTHFCLIALARSLQSGAGSALIYDHLVQNSREHDYVSIEGHARAYALYARLASWLVAGTLVEWNPLSPYWMSAIAGVAATMMAIGLPAAKQHHRSPKNGTSIEPRRVPVALGMLQGTGLFVMMRILVVHLLQPVLLQRQIPVSWFGVILAGMTLIEAWSATRTGLWQRILPSRNRAVLMGSALMAMALIATSHPHPMLWGAGLMIFSIVAGSVAPIQKSIMQSLLAGTDKRATLLSIESIVDRSMCALLLLPLGDLLNSGKLDQSLWISASTMFIVVSIASALLARYHLRSDHQS